MKKFLITAAVGAVLALSSAGTLAAQPWQAGLPGEGDMFTLGLRLGAVSPTTTLPDGSKFSGGLGGGISATYWAHRFLGVRASYELGKTEGNRVSTQAPSSQEDPTMSFFGGELDLRYPMRSGGIAWFPYAGVGLGGKMYDWANESTGIDRDLTFAWNLTGGVDIRPVSSPWVGVVLEAKRYSSKYEWLGFFWDEPSFNDLVFSIGVSLNR